MAKNEDFSDELNLLLNQYNHEQQANLFPLYNSNINTTNNMFACEQKYFQSLAPMSNTAMNPAIGNNYAILMPHESVPLPHYYSNNMNSRSPLQDRTNYFDARGNDRVDPNWEAIDAFLAGRVRRSADVTKIYRCGVCNAEFVSPQAQGGHMSAHSRGRKNKEVRRSTKPKGFKKSASKKKAKSFVKDSIC